MNLEQSKFENLIQVINKFHFNEGHYTGEAYNLIDNLDERGLQEIVNLLKITREINPMTRTPEQIIADYWQHGKNCW